MYGDQHQMLKVMEEIFIKMMIKIVTKVNVLDLVHVQIIKIPIHPQVHGNQIELITIHLVVIIMGIIIITTTAIITIIIIMVMKVVLHVIQVKIIILLHNQIQIHHLLHLQEHGQKHPVVQLLNLHGEKLISPH